jgi:lipoprotein NlpI
MKQVQVQDGKFSIGDAPPAWVEDVALPPADATRPLVLRLADAQFLVADVPVTYFHSALTINDASGLSDLSQLPIDFIPEYQKLQIHSIRILRGGDALDRTKSVSVRFLQRDTGLEQGVYSDVVTASFLIDDLRVGDTLEYSFSVSGQNPVFDGKYVESSNWDQSYPISRRRLVLNYPASRAIKWRLVGDVAGKSIGPVESVKGDMRKLVFEETAIPEVIAEPALPTDFVRLRWLQFTEFSDWNEVARWADKLFAVNTTESPEFSKLVDELKSLKSDEERVAKALEVVQSEIRYFSVALGENSHRPAQPGEVLKRRYGDCKDKSFLLTALLKAVSIDSRPMLLSVRRRTGLDKMLPSPLSFDHAIVQVKLGNRTHFLDATRLGQYGRLDRMGQTHEDSEGLVVAPDTSAMTTIKTPNIADLVRNEISETALVPELGGEGEIRRQTIANGAAAESMRVFFQQTSRDRLQAAYAEHVASNYPGAKLIGDVAMNDDRRNNVITVTTRFTVPKLTKEEGQLWYLRFSPSNLREAIAPLPTSGRTMPLALSSFPYEAKYSLSVEFPGNVRAPRDGLKHSVKNKSFVYDAAIAYGGSNTTTNITLKTLTPVVEPKDFKAYTDDVSSLGHVIAILVPLPKKFVRSGKVAAKEDFGKRLRRNYTEQVAAQTKLIGSGTLKGEKLASAYCERSASKLYLGKIREAFADLDKADKLVPNDPVLARCRGEANFRSAAFDKSAADYTRAIALDDKDAWSFQARGMDRFYSGDYEGAITDFAKATELADDRRRPYTDLWLASSYRRLKKELPDDLKARAAADPRGDWPRPVLATMTGLIKVDDLLAILESKTGDEKITAGSETYFYLGQLHFDQGDRAAAEEYFRKALATDVFPYIEYITSKFELDARAVENQTVTGSVAAPNPASGSAAMPASTASPTDINAPVQSEKAAPVRKNKARKEDPNWNTNPLQVQ